MTLTLRRATQNDCSQLGAWNLALIREEGHRNTMTAPQLEQRMRQWVASGEYTVQMIERDGSSVGYVVWRQDAPKEVFVRQFYVWSPARRQGVGREAVLRLRNVLWPRNARVVVSALVEHPAGLAFWRACGFTDYAVTLEQLPSDIDT